MKPLSIYYILFFSLVFIFSKHSRGIVKKSGWLLFNLAFVASFGKVSYVLMLLVVIVYSFLCSRWIKKVPPSLAFISMLPFVLNLMFFKFIPLVTSSVIMPIGLSFYTFKAIRYCMEIRKNDDFVPSFLDTVLYLSFFPTLLAGPINKAKPFIEQLNTTPKFNYVKAKNGFLLCFLGMFQKLVFADYLSSVVNTIYSNNTLSGSFLIVAMILYSFQLYIDFDGYSNIAIGISAMMGIQLESNFKTPYLSSTIQEFWSRWHISLSSWFKEYIYIPLGGNRCGVIRKYMNVMIVFLCSGVWHGSTINFVLWGFLHGVLNIIEDIILKGMKPIIKPSIITKIIGIVINFSLVTIFWVFFRLPSFQEALTLLTKVFVPMKFDLNVLKMSQREGYWLITIVIITIVTDILRNKMNMIKFIKNQPFVVRWCFYTLLIALAFIFGVYGTGYNASDFVYVTF